MTEFVLKTENAFGFEKASIYLIIQTQPGSHFTSSIDLLAFLFQRNYHIPVFFIGIHVYKYLALERFFTTAFANLKQISDYSCLHGLYPMEICQGNPFTVRLLLCSCFGACAKII